MFDINNKDSFERVFELYKELHKKEKDQKNNKNFISPKKVFVGCKSDLNEEEGLLSYYNEFLVEYKIKIVESSSKMNINIKETFDDFIRDIYFDPQIEVFDKNFNHLETSKDKSHQNKMTRTGKFIMIKHPSHSRILHQ